MSRQLGYTPRNTFIHRINPLLKFFLLILTLILVIIIPYWFFALVLLSLTLLFFYLADIPFTVRVGRTKFLLFFSFLLLIVQILVTTNGSIFLFIIPRFGEVGPAIPVTDYGIERGLSMSIRFLLIVFASMLFVSVTDPTLLAHSLTKLKTPYQYAFALIIALRFLPLFDFENKKVQMAQQSRGLSVEIGGIRKLVRTIRYTFFPLLVSALSRVETLSLSMDGRGFGYDPHRTYLRESEWQKSDSIILFSIIFLIISYFLIGFYMTL